jgi:ABC-type lipoprotein release transport system permease subunit
VILTKLMTGLLFQVEATDPLTFTGMALVLVVIAAAACLAPARRASTVDPMVVLRTT